MREVRISNDFTASVGSLVLTISKFELTLLYAINGTKLGKGEVFSQSELHKYYQQTLRGRWNTLIAELPEEHSGALETLFSLRFQKLEAWRTIVVHFPAFPSATEGTYKFIGITRNGGSMNEDVTPEDLRSVAQEVSSFDKEIASFMSSAGLPIKPLTFED